MKPIVRKAFLHPIVRVAAVFLLLALGFTLWDSLDTNRTAIRAAATPLPSTITTHFSFSPDGKTLAGCSDDGKFNLVPLVSSTDPIGLGTPSPVSLLPDAICAASVWSPDGQRLLMAYLPRAGGGDAPGYFLITREEKPTVRFIPLKGGVNPTIPPAWSPDGQRIAYMSGALTVSQGGLWLLDMKTLARKRLILGLINSPVFSADGRVVYFEQDTALANNGAFDKDMDDYPHIWSLVSVPATGGAAIRIAQWTQGSLMPFRSAMVTPYEKGVRYVRYFFTMHGSRLEVWDAPMGKQPGAKRMEMPIAVGNRINDLSWSADGRRSVYLEFKTEGGPTSLKVADIPAGTIKELAAGRGTPDFAPKGKSAVGTNWSDATLSASGTLLAATVASVVESVNDASSDDHEDEETPVNVDPATVKPLVLSLPPLSH
jgi:dipeptidyl aminopeptidase/acylaminoacyl peptidase